MTSQHSEPKWIIFYDGHCGLCHHTVTFVLHQEQEPFFNFAPLQGLTCQKMLDEKTRQQLPDSLVVRCPQGKLFVKSEGALKIFSHLPPPWPYLVKLSEKVPQKIRDSIYDGIAKIRHRLFKQPDNTCPLIPENLRSRFLP